MYLHKNKESKKMLEENMKLYCKLSLIELAKYEKIPTKKEWNRNLKYKKVLSSISLQYVLDLRWEEIYYYAKNKYGDKFKN